MRRSRRAASKLAEDHLEKDAISDAEILSVLELWHFKQNNKRINVLPAGANFVHSDTLGLVKTRMGTVVVTKITNQHRPVFALMCRWLSENMPAVFKQPFPFTSISVNYGYAARKHRDGNNSGPSIGKAFGDFVGGHLKYWENDNGECAVSDLKDSAGQAYDVKREMVLFDGCRCHMVTPFTGERYSLVYFTVSDYEKIKPSTKTSLADSGVTFTSESALAYYASYLSPPRGTSKSIRRMFGYNERLGAFQASGTSLARVPQEVLLCVLRHHLEPQIMATTCALSRTLRHTCYDPCAWEGSVIDARCIRPKGRRAFCHYSLWSKSAAVL